MQRRAEVDASRGSSYAQPMRPRLFLGALVAAALTSACSSIVPGWGHLAETPMHGTAAAPAPATPLQLCESHAWQRSFDFPKDRDLAYAQELRKCRQVTGS